MSIVTARHPDYATVRDWVEALTEKYPFLQKMESGRSSLGRSIPCLSLGQAQDKVLYVGGVHGSEWLTVLTLMRFMEELCEAIDTGRRVSNIDVRNAMVGRGLVVIPCLNPDGTEIALRGDAGALWNARQVSALAKGDFSCWQANARGVDLNHNFDAGWEILHQMEMKEGIRGPAPRQYGGPAPHSEPESSWLVKLCRTYPFRHALAMHSQGEEIYWSYGENTPLRAKVMAGVLAASSGYQMSSPDGLASHGGFKDWFIEEFHRPAFTVEIGRGKNPLPLSDYPDVYDKMEEMLLLAALM